MRLIPTRHVRHAEIPPVRRAGRLVGAAVTTVLLAVALVACAGGFSIEGRWKSVGDSVWGQAAPGAIITFDGSRANLYSPSDTYAFYSQGGAYHLDVTGLLGGTTDFNVQVIDGNDVELTIAGDPSTKLVLERVG